MGTFLNISDLGGLVWGLNGSCNVLEFLHLGSSLGPGLLLPSCHLAHMLLQSSNFVKETNSVVVAVWASRTLPSPSKLERMRILSIPHTPHHSSASSSSASSPWPPSFQAQASMMQSSSRATTPVPKVRRRLPRVATGYHSLRAPGLVKLMELEGNLRRSMKINENP